MGRVPGTRLDLLDQPSPGTLPEAPLHSTATIWNWEPSSESHCTQAAPRTAPIGH
jgi:hypothetical protein